jgi:putative membrane protein
MERLLLRWLVSAAAIGIVAWLLPGIRLGEGTTAVLTALVGAGAFGILNLLVKPVLVVLSCPLILLSLGLFLFLINAALLLLASSLSQALGFGFHVDTWGSALLGSILITVVTWILSAFVGPHKHRRERRET